MAILIFMFQNRGLRMAAIVIFPLVLDKQDRCQAFEGIEDRQRGA